MNRPSRLALGFVLLALATPVAAKEHKSPVEKPSNTYVEGRQLALNGTDVNEKITRGEFVRAVVSRVYAADNDVGCFTEIGSYPEAKYNRLFSDVTVFDHDAQELCVGLKTGIIRGMPDGSFRPDTELKASEAASIVYRAYSVGPLDRKNIQGAAWFSYPLYDVDVYGALPRNLRDSNYSVTWGDAFEMLDKLEAKDAQRKTPILKNRQALNLMGLPGKKEENLQPMTVTARGIEVIVPRRSRR